VGVREEERFYITAIEYAHVGEPPLSWRQILFSKCADIGKCLSDTAALFSGGLGLKFGAQ
jgi:hypothetical protein